MAFRTKVRRHAVVALVVAFGASSGLPVMAEMPVVTDVDRQPLVAATQRLVEAMRFAGAPLPTNILESLAAVDQIQNDREAVRRIQKILDPLCIAHVGLNPESRVKVGEGPAAKELIQQGWRVFLVKVINEAGINPVLGVGSDQARPVFLQGKGERQKPAADASLVSGHDVSDRFLDLSMLRREPLKERLSGLPVEYCVLLLYSRDAGAREASLAFDIGAGTQDLGFRSVLPILFRCKPAVKVTLRVADVDGSPTMAGFVIRDPQGRVYPLPSKRLSPDFFFHEQVYRADGEHVMLPPGRYTFFVTRGPEYVPCTFDAVVPEVAEHTISVTLKRWFHAAARGWYSGDHHVHAAGCAHYDSPSEGASPEAMARHIRGEDLTVGCVLSWGPCWYAQKKFFDGRVSSLSARDSLLRYDVEVSGFPSSHAGHLALLRLTEDDYPGTTQIEEWPSWTLPVMEWAHGQGGVVGYTHAGWGLALPDVMPDGSRAFVGQPYGGAPEGWAGRAASEIPDDAMPRFDGIGANEFIVTAPLGACDFIGVGDTPSNWEMNIWYHALNCGMTSRISGETDFPCIYGERVGMSRGYVGLDASRDFTYDAWIAGLRDGRSYVSDGRAHILDFRVDAAAVGQRNAGGGISRLDVATPRTVTVAFDAAAILEEKPTEATESIRKRRLDDKPFWHIERCRISASRRVPVEIVVNGRVVATRELEADGRVESFAVPVEITRSSWVAVRILPAAHTNPVFVHVADEPIRASRRSAQWCLKAVDVCWESKQQQLRPAERDAAQRAYNRASGIYREILQKSPAD